MHRIIEKIIFTAWEATPAAGKQETPVSLSDALLILLICMAVIFAVLGITMGFLYLMKHFDRIIDRAKGAGKDKEDKTAETLEEPTGLPIGYEDDTDEAVAAAITAAITVYMENESISAPFIIKNIKRIK